MSNKRWDANDKIELMKLYSQGKSYEDISKTLDRSPLAIKLRLESIVYDNLVKGKPVHLLTRMLNTNSDTIKQFYYSHKSFKEGRGDTVIDVVFPPDNQINNHREKIISHTLVNDNILGKNNNNIEDQKHRIVINKEKNINQPSLVGGNNSNHIDSIDSIEQENHILEGIIKNYRMKRQVRKLYIEGKLDEKSIVMYEKLQKNNKDIK
jgi:hypothetical protein